MSYRLSSAHDALFLDIDGTLLDIAPTPGQVVVPPSLLSSLSVLQEKLGGALAVISGRQIKEIDALFRPLRLAASGVHGAEWRIASSLERKKPLPHALTEAISKEMARYPGIIVEDKKYAVSVHYRKAPEWGKSIGEFLQKAVNAHPGLALLKGKMVHEVIQKGYDKGTALERFMHYAPFAGRRPVFLGDDESDVYAIDACRKLGGAAERIGHGKNHPFHSPGHVRIWLKGQASWL